MYCKGVLSTHCVLLKVWKVHLTILLVLLFPVYQYSVVVVQ